MGGGGNNVSIESPRLTSMRIQTSAYGKCVPLLYGRTRVSGNLIWYHDFTAIPHTTTQSSGGKGGGGGSTSQTTYTYRTALIAGLCEGPVSAVVAVWKDKEKYADDATKGAALAQIGLSLYPGSTSQAPLPYVSTNHPDEALAYRRLAYVGAGQYDLSDNATLPNHSFEIKGLLPFQPGVIDDASPAEILLDVLTHPQRGAGYPAGRIADLSLWRSYCAAAEIFISPCWTEQTQASEMIGRLCEIGNAAPVYSEGVLKIVPYGDEAISSAYGTYTPALDPVYALSDDDFLDTGDEYPVTVIRGDSADAFNQAQIKFFDRGAEYNEGVSTASDQANIELFGLRHADPVEMHEICTAAVARRVAQIKLQRMIGVRATYKFKLGWKYCLLEPMDIVTLTEGGDNGLVNVPVRITAIEEDAEGNLQITAEDAPPGVSSTIKYPVQTVGGYAGNFAVAPGPVSNPVFVERPVYQTTTGLAVGVAVSGTGQYWGGCDVWVSYDGSTYKQAGHVIGGNRYGYLTNSITSATGQVAAVKLQGKGGQINGGASVEAAANATLCVIGDELVNFTTAALTGENAYNLTLAQRGAMHSIPAAQAVGTKFVRLDDSITWSDSVPLDQIGKPLYFKFTSFNVFGTANESLADVPAYPYTITGVMAKLPPDDVTGLGLSITNTGIVAYWSAPADPDWDRTELSLSPTFSTSIDGKKGLQHVFPWQAAGTMTVYARHVDKFGARSSNIASASIYIQAPNAVQMMRTDVQQNIVNMQWADSKSSQPILRYYYKTGNSGDSFANSTLYGSAGSDGRSDLIRFSTSGAKRIWMVAVDVAGNESTPISVDINVVLPNNYAFSSEWQENWTGTKVNAVLANDGSLWLPVKNETWQQHFANNGWATPAAQASAGYPLYFEPSATSGSYSEDKDLGKLFPSIKIAAFVSSQTLAGSVTPSVQIYWSADNVTWITQGLGTEAVATNVRYVRVVYSVTAAGGDDLVKISGVRVQCWLEEKSETAAVQCISTDTNGTLYTTTKGFYDVQTVDCTPADTTIDKAYAVINDSGAPATPANVYVLAYKLVSGVWQRASGPVYISINGA